VALKHIAVGQPVIKYGHPIGVATDDILAGEHVHTHNLHSARASTLVTATVPPSPFPTVPTHSPPSVAAPASFPGFRRPDGLVGTRNHVLVLPSVVCANAAARHITAEVDGTVVLPHPYGCSQLDAARVHAVLAGLGRHPNVAAVLVVGLGCETVQAAALATEIAASGKPVEVLSIQEQGGISTTVTRGADIVRGMVAEAARQVREPCPLAGLIVGLECGGSDATSGLVANPVIGQVADRVIAAGGTVLLSETTELMGAEHILAWRTTNSEVARRIIEIVASVEQAALEAGVDLRGLQPTPGNMAGGVTTIEEKSLGCVYKAGSAPVQSVLDYGQRPPDRGLYVMDTPGQDAESITGMVAGGAQVILFSTGRGTPLGAPLVPTIKLTANPQTATRMAEHVDLSVASILEGESSVETEGDGLWQLLLSVAGGQITAAETWGQGELAITRAGPTV
ncbi:MAG: UxaA family hydrolase, partial [Chloroflexota bacterium]|nr:UxaA family hydrolase [Chloroflexota bacterium]